MNQPQAPKKFAPERKVGKLRDEETPFVADNDILHSAGAPDEDPDLATGLLGKFGHPPGQFIADDLFYRDAAAIESFQSIDLAFLEADQITVKLMNKKSP
jgi:hypothetical protein